MIGFRRSARDPSEIGEVELIERFLALNPITQSLAATCCTWFVKALGAAVVFPFRTVDRRMLDGMLGFAAGAMISVSRWSPLGPALVLAEG
jgi:zinc transporter, ZIP family